MPPPPPRAIFRGMMPPITDGAVVTPVVNGEARSLPGGSTLGALLRALALDPRQVVVEHNREIIRDRAVLDGRLIGDGDAVEIVQFVGGG